jgi:hypothetical protein
MPDRVALSRDRSGPLTLADSIRSMTDTYGSLARIQGTAADMPPCGEHHHRYSLAMGHSEQGDALWLCAGRARNGAPGGWPLRGSRVTSSTSPNCARRVPKNRSNRTQVGWCYDASEGKAPGWGDPPHPPKPLNPADFPEGSPAVRLWGSERHPPPRTSSHGCGFLGSLRCR